MYIRGILNKLLIISFHYNFKWIFDKNFQFISQNVTITHLYIKRGEYYFTIFHGTSFHDTLLNLPIFLKFESNKLYVENINLFEFFYFSQLVYPQIHKLEKKNKMGASQINREFCRGEVVDQDGDRVGKGKNSAILLKKYTV